MTTRAATGVGQAPIAHLRLKAETDVLNVKVRLGYECTRNMIHSLLRSNFAALLFPRDHLELHLHLTETIFKSRHGSKDKTSP